MLISTKTRDGQLRAAELREVDGKLMLQYPPPWKKFCGELVKIIKTDRAVYLSYNYGEVVACRVHGEELFTAREIGPINEIVSASARCPIEAIVKVLGEAT